MAHVRRKLVDVHKVQGSAIADEAIRRIAQLYSVEKEARRSPPDCCVELRQLKAMPIFDDMKVWLHAQLPGISGKLPLAGVIRYALTRMARLRPYLDHGLLELDTDDVEKPLFSKFSKFSKFSGFQVFRLAWVWAVCLARLRPCGRKKASVVATGSISRCRISLIQ